MTELNVVSLALLGRLRMGSYCAVKVTRYVVEVQIEVQNWSKGPVYIARTRELCWDVYHTV